MNLAIGCSLACHANVLTPFVFSLEAGRLPQQTLRAGSLVTTSDLGEPGRSMAPESGNRYAGYLVCAGDFRIEYKAEPSRDPVAVDPRSVTGLTALDSLGGSAPGATPPTLRSARSSAKRNRSRRKSRLPGQSLVRC